MECGPEVIVISMVPEAMGSEEEDAVLLLLMVVMVPTVSEIMAAVTMVAAAFDLEAPALSPVVDAGIVVAVLVVPVVVVDRCCALSPTCGLRFSSSLLLVLLLFLLLALAFPGSFVLLLLLLLTVSTATSCSFITSSHSFSH